jgi:hypothetical protein
MLVGALVTTALLTGCVIPGAGEMDSSVDENGSFEVVRSGMPVNWIMDRYAIRNNEVEFSLDTTDAVDGQQSLKIVVHAVDDHSWNAPWFFRTGPAEPGATYAVSFWLKSTACVLEMVIRNEGEDPLFGLSTAERKDYAAHPPIRRVIGGGETDTDRWRQFRYVYKVPETDGSLRFELRIVRPCTLWIDDVQIERAEGEPLSKPKV